MTLADRLRELADQVERELSRHDLVSAKLGGGPLRYVGTFANPQPRDRTDDHRALYVIEEK